MQSLAIIPARGGSKSVKNKNIRNFDGKPLIAWTIEKALASNVSRVLVTTDSEEIREIAIKYGAEVPFIRSAKLAQDTTAIEPVLLDVLTKLKENENYVPNCIALLMPTQPFRYVSDINDALQIYTDKSASCVISVTPAVANHNPNWMLKLDDRNKVTLFTGEPLTEMKTRRQDLPPVFIRNDFVYVLSPENLYMEKPGLYGDKVELMIASEDRADVDINRELDWHVAEATFKLYRQDDS